MKVGTLRTVPNCLHLPGFHTWQDGCSAAGESQSFFFKWDSSLFWKNILIIMRLSFTLLLLSVQKSEAHSYVSLLARVNSLGCCHHNKSQVNLRKELGHGQHSPPFKSLLHRKWLKMWSKATFHMQKQHLPRCEIMIRRPWTGLTGPSSPTAASLLTAT